MSIKILQITAAYKPAYIYGGPTMSVSKLCEALAEDKGNNELEVLTTTANGKTELNVAPNSSTVVDGVKVTYFTRLTKDHTHFSPALFSGLAKTIKAHRLAKNNTKLVVHIHAWWNLVSIFSCSVAKWYNIPVLLSPRGMLTNYTANNRNASFKSLIHLFMGKRLLKYCHIHATSEKEKQDVLAIINPKSVTVIPNLVNFPTFQEAFKNEPAEYFRLIFLSRVEEKKGIELLFEGLIALPFNWKLTIAGSGEEAYVNSLKQKALTLNLANQIDWIGQVKNEDKFKLMAQHDLLVLTSYNENFANVVVECLSVGTPVLLSNEVGLADYVQEKNLGWITSLSPNTIQKNIIEAFEAKEQRKNIRDMVPAIIANDFDSKNLIKKYITLYSTIN